MPRSICVHAHFYQPPRENPWLEAIELQPSAHPYHDWNQRITSECYSPNLTARILDPEHKIRRIVNNYRNISFNYGPTLLSWLERHDPETYQGIIASDIKGRENFNGHGPAIAQCYNHLIMPLANSRDKRAQVVWGLRDFEYRFGRKAEGMWLPETGVDIESLELLAEYGIKFTVLAPHQCKRVREIGKRRWHESVDASVDPRIPYLCRLPSGKSIVLFFYDGPISRDVAFGKLLNNGENFAYRLLGVFSENGDGQLSHIATDGETYGHHHKMGDMALAYAQDHIMSRKLAGITVYGEYLENHPPVFEAEIVENSSWSCMHGVERWRENCGCHTGGEPGWTQAWRGPLREALDWLRDEAAAVYHNEGEGTFTDVWAARNDYIDVVLNREVENIERFLKKHCPHSLDPRQKVRALKLLEMQRHAMLMYTSCGWFFADLSGIETVQILQYAGRVSQLVKDVSGRDPEARFLELLSKAASNIPAYGSGREVYERFVRPAVINIPDIAAHYAVSSLFVEYPDISELYCYTVQRKAFERRAQGRDRLVTGRAVVRSNITLEEREVAFAALHLGDHHFLCGADDLGDERAFARFEQELGQAFGRGDMAGSSRQIEGYFRETRHSLRHFFKDEQRKVLYHILDENLSEIEEPLRQINEHRAPIINVAKQLNIPLPKVLANTISVMFDTDFLRALGENPPDFERLVSLIGEVREYGLEIDRETLTFLTRRKIEDMMALLETEPRQAGHLRSVERLLSVIKPLGLKLDLWKPQNIYFEVGRQYYPGQKQRAGERDEQAGEWIAAFDSLGGHLNIKPRAFLEESRAPAGSSR